MSAEHEKPVELEQVPLKSDTDAPAGATEDATPTPNAVKKSWLFKKAKKTVIEEPPNTEEKTAAEEKLKKKCWWSKHKSEQQQKCDHISIGIDLVNRDEKGINEHVRLGFEDIFGEAETQHSWDCVWRLVYRVFMWTRRFVYRLCSLIIGLPAAIVFGILFGILSVINVFACVPFAKLLTIPANWLSKTWCWMVHAIIDPVALSVSLLFSSFTIKKYGISSQPTDVF
ncbi:Caveolin 1 [Parelaphostrongylus tenuis]|uniref:Caveolin n=1 Tax=Parelaphostrongylus tenuis TaxID=148309 RepID=A0AAD5MT80_PARTN|nr:Caveolin 1 [Parelaphostrongylus tenuis]